MIIHDKRITLHVNSYLTRMGWGNELMFFKKVISNIEQQGDTFGFWAFLNKVEPDTLKLREILANYKYLSLAHNETQSLELSHFNDVDGIDSAIAYLSRAPQSAVKPHHNIGVCYKPLNSLNY